MISRKAEKIVIASLFLIFCVILGGQRGTLQDSQTEDQLPSKIRAYVTNFPNIVQHYSTDDVLATDGLYTIKLLTRPAEVCQFDEGSKSKTMSIAFFIKTSPAETELRNAIRNSWALGFKDFGDLLSAVYFVVGQAKEDDINAVVSHEATMFQDLFVLDFFDSYRNVSLKSYSMLLLAAKYCGSAQFIFNGDSDTLFLPENIHSLLSQLPSERSGIVGSCWSGHRPIRDSKHKWVFPKEAWPFDVLPLYCSGTAYLMTRGVPSKLIENVPSVHFVQTYNHDDVLVTGVLAILAGVDRFDLPGFKRWVPVTGINPCKKETMTVHDWRPQMLVKTAYFQWKRERTRCENRLWQLWYTMTRYF